MSATNVDSTRIKVKSYSTETIFSEALKDIIEGIKYYRLWIYIASNEIRLRYRRTVLGPFWITLNLAIFIATMGMLFSNLWKTPTSNFLPYFSAGYMTWIYLYSTITESCTMFVSAEGTLKQLALPYSLFVWVTVLRNLIVLLHHSLAYLLIILIFQVPINFNIFLLIPGIILISVFTFWSSLAIGLLCARFRDVQSVLVNLLQIMMFITPIFWAPEQLQGVRSTIFVEFNPLYHFISLLRLPLLGEAPDIKSWIIALSVTALVVFCSFIFFAKQRRKLIFWL